MRNVHDLTPQQESFAVALAGGKSQADAYRTAYPASLGWKASTVHQRASRLASKREVCARVCVLQTEIASSAVLNAWQVLRELRRLVLSDIGRVIDDKGRIKLPHELDDDTRAAIASFEMDEMGRVKYRLWDKNSALDKAMKFLGQYQEDNKQKPAEIRRIELVPLGSAPSSS